MSTPLRVGPGDRGASGPGPASTGQRGPLPPTATRVTSVFGTAQPPRGVSGTLRRRAYAIPEHHTRHWLWLVLADRIELLEHRVAAAGGGRAIVVGCLAVGFALWAVRRKGR